ncbi:putative transmembrane protein [Desulfosarcina variabilis str. Montpellier]
MSGNKDYLYVDDIRVFSKISASVSNTTSSADPIFGVTIDDISNPNAIIESLSSLARCPFARIVFDEYVQPAYYKDAVRKFHTVAGIMGEILDSYYVKEYSQEAYAERTHSYVQAMAEDVDVWEVGNEINGEWLGPGAMAKAAAAYDIVKAAGEPTALTLYYNGTYDDGTPTANNCWEAPENQMQVWAEKNVPKRMKQGLDWVLVSFYEGDCENISPDWDQVFAELHRIFPNSKLGFGEVGTNNSSRKEEILRRYYSMNRIRPEFIGGFFWWYFKQDMTPKNTNLWNILNEYAQSWDKQYD